jgi:hypothetical protein
VYNTLPFVGSVFKNLATNSLSFQYLFMFSTITDQAGFGFAIFLYFCPFPLWLLALWIALFHYGLLYFVLNKYFLVCHINSLAFLSLNALFSTSCGKCLIVTDSLKVLLMWECSIFPLLLKDGFVLYRVLSW